jgi:hypothetical protein
MRYLYPSNLKNWFLAAPSSSLYGHRFKRCPFDRLHRPCASTWPASMIKKLKRWDCQIPNFSGYLGITFILTTLVLSFSQLHAQIILDEVMSKDEQKITGVANLSRNQKIALEAWIDRNFVLKSKEQASLPELSLSLNIDNGQKLQLSDNSLWEIAPGDVATAAVWITPFPVKIEPSGDPDYPCLIVNLNSGISVKARPVPTPMTTPSQKN